MIQGIEYPENVKEATQESNVLLSKSKYLLC